MAYYVDTSYERETTAVGVIQTIIIPSTFIGKYDEALVELINDGADVFNGLVQVSFTGVDVDPWVTLPDSAFEAMAAGGDPRVARIWGGYRYIRIVGQFAALAGNVRKSLGLMYGVSQR